jgi:hypothetical protein
MGKTATVYITDKSNRKMFNTLCSADYVYPEIRNMERHLKSARNNPKAYHFLDLETAKIMVNDVEHSESPKITLSDEEILEVLGL